MNERSFGTPRRRVAARRRPRETRAAILQASFQLFLHQGYHGTSMRQIAGRARLAPAAIYYHFRNKEAIFLTLLGERMPQRALLPALAAAEGDSVEAIVRDALARMAPAVADQYDNMRLLLIELLEFQGRHARHLADEFLPPVLTFVNRLQLAPGGLRPLDPTIVARAFLGLLMSYAITVTFFPKIRAFAPRPNDLRDLGSIFLSGVLVAPADPPQKEGHPSGDHPARHHQR
jgi:AcrR family transcriptional regulator